MKLTSQGLLGLRWAWSQSLWCLVLATSCASLTAADEPTPATPLRLGIPEFAIGPEGESLRADGARLVDLLTARLSAEPGFELVERAALDLALKEAALSLSGRTKPEDAIRIGKILRADWFALGSFLKVEATNVVLLKVVDAQRGTIRDLSAFPVESTNLQATAELLAKFVVSSKTAVRRLDQRVFLAFGTFEDLGVHNRYPDFPNQLRATMTRRYAGSAISVVERAQVAPLLQELRLAQSGLAESSGTAASPQPAFILVDGLYQSFRDQESKINMVLRIEPIGGQMETVSLNELPGTPLEIRIFETIERVVRNPRKATAPPTRQSEAQVQLARGKELARIEGVVQTHPLAGMQPVGEYRAPRVAALTEAIQAFQSALLLDPESVEAKYCLAMCLSDPHIRKVEPARDYWREVIATSTNRVMVLEARRAFAYSYIETDPSQALELLTAVRKETTNSTQLVRLGLAIDALQKQVMKGKISTEAAMAALDEKWRPWCRTAVSPEAARQGVNPVAVEGLILDYATLFEDRQPSLRRGPVEAVVARFAGEFPQLRPYFVAAYLRWLESQISSLSKATLEVAAGTWKKQYFEVLDTCERNPDSILSVSNFYSSSLNKDLALFFRMPDHELAQRVANLLQQQGRKFLTPQARDVVDLLSGGLEFQAQRWKEALTFFERIEDREFYVGLTGPWGKGYFASPHLAAEACRRQLPASNSAQPGARALSASAPTSGVVLPHPKPVHVLGGETVNFVVGKTGVWLGEEAGISLFHPESGKAEPVRLSVDVKRMPYVNPFLCMAVVGNKVWIGTQGSGLIGIDETTHSVTNYTVADGLLAPTILALLGTTDRLWMGFATSLGGGAGYVDLNQGRFIGMVPELPKDLVKSPPKAALSSSLIQASSIPRTRIDAMAQSPSGRIWLGTQGGVTEYTPATTGLWKRVQMDCDGLVSGLAANDRYIVVTCFEPQGSNSRDTRPRSGGVLIYDLKKGGCKKVSSRDGLTSNYMRCAAIDGDYAWVGGQAFVGLLNLPLARVEAVWNFPGVYRVRSVQVTEYDVWFSIGPGLYRLPRNGVLDASLAESKADSKPSLPEDAESQLVERLKAARSLVHERNQAGSLYGQIKNDEATALSKEFEATVRQVAGSFPLLEPQGGELGGFSKLQLNKRGAGFDGFRFRNNSSEPKNLGWVFALEQPSNMEFWFIVSAEDQKMRGFRTAGETDLNYGNAPWSTNGNRYSVRAQYLRDGSLLPGKEYVIWFTHKTNTPQVAYVGFQLFPATEQCTSSGVIDGALGLTRR